MQEDTTSVDLAMLKEKALLIRQLSISMMTHGKMGHPGGSLSVADILAALYFYRLRLNPADPLWDERDRFVLSKGHTCPALYAALALRGFFPVAELYTFGSLEGRVQCHPSPQVPGIEIPTGSLGQGLSAGVGMAWAARLLGQRYRVWVLVGDGEINSGQIWEAAMAAAHYHLGNLTAILDYNKVQAKGRCADIMGIEPVAEKWRAFNWAVRETNGHDMEALVAALDAAAAHDAGPLLLIAHTVKGKGVSFMEGSYAWHARAPTAEEGARALAELGVNDADAFTARMMAMTG